MDLFRQLEISLGRKVSGKKIETLENKPYLTPANIGSPGVRDLGEVLAVNNNAATRRPRLKQAAEQMQQCRLLPQPDGPMIATNSPSPTSKDRPRRAGTSSLPILYDFFRSMVWRIGFIRFGLVKCFDDLII